MTQNRLNTRNYRPFTGLGSSKSSAKRVNYWRVEARFAVKNYIW